MDMATAQIQAEPMGTPQITSSSVHRAPHATGSFAAPRVRHAMTVDVEDYFQVSAFESVVDRDRWQGFERRVCANTHRLLDLFDDRDIKATFFVLGWVAEREPGLVREIAARGHEIACHGYSHRLVYTQTPAVFEEETRRSKHLLEDIVQQPVAGYRAASYSITRDSLWALDILAEAGFTYDSSIFPVHHDRYGIPGAPSFIHRIVADGQPTLIEFPLSSLSMFGQNIPVAGGGYFRLYPYRLTRWLLDRLSAGADAPFVFYLHPWEVDPSQPRVAGASAVSRFRHYLNLERCLPRLRHLLQDFAFGTMADAIAQVHHGDVASLPAHRYR
jgi:polysaccharide deacetylase family protein (PEP-CTERM system associated)